VSILSRTILAIKALDELGYDQISAYARYQLGVYSGFYKITTDRAIRITHSQLSNQRLYISFPIPETEKLSNQLGKEGCDKLLKEADEINSGKVRLFGGPPLPLKLGDSRPLKHWSAYESGKVKLQNLDIKYIWEPARFGWALTLGRAYLLSGNEEYAQSFWQYCEFFSSQNPANMGPHWISAQEVALRLITLVFASRMFQSSVHFTPERETNLVKFIITHAARIPPTLIYARAQNNNHLLSEAAGLYTAGIVLPDHPQADNWRKSGLYWFDRGLQSQISPDGSYTQHSTNYHRLMLQLALWVNLLIQSQTGSIDIRAKNDLYKGLSSITRKRLSKASQWLLTLLDPDTGHVPNLGPNDGAYLFPLSGCSHNDYRPVVQSASKAFLGNIPLEPGPWDEMLLWFNQDNQTSQEDNSLNRVSNLRNFSPDDNNNPLVINHNNSWAYIRVANFDSRPGHADQLHFDLWWRGINVTPDVGTYQYNALPPWDNALKHTAVHNTITIDGADQMTNAGRFLWLDWAQGSVVECCRRPDGSIDHLIVQHDGYRRFNLVHQRTISTIKDGWSIKDEFLPYNELENSSRITVLNKTQLHWLVPDWSWESDISSPKERFIFRFASPYGWIKLAIHLQNNGLATSDFNYTIYRAGNVIFGKGNNQPTWGWQSPTYGYKYPALLICADCFATESSSIISNWIFPW
jgi:hypothetical protein